jgi:biopolymer transport protein ExbB
MSDSVNKLIVQGTFGLLLFASVLTWALVLIKVRQRWVVKAQNQRFTRALGAGTKLSALRKLKDHKGPFWRLSQAGLSALVEAEADSQAGESSRESLERALQAQIVQERRASESGLAVLASIGSTSPFVGLFGTVFGIIHALRAIGTAGSASLEIVAKPIGEALVATGIGIAVAVPAVLAYNYFVRGLKVQVSDLEQFGSGLLGAVAKDVRPAKLHVERTGSFEGRREATV